MAAPAPSNEPVSPPRSEPSVERASERSAPGAYLRYLPLAALTLVLVYAVLTLAHVPETATQLSVRTEVLTFRLDSKLHLSRLRVSGFEVHGALSLEAPGAALPSKVAPDETFSVGPVSSSEGSPIGSTLRIEIDAGQTLTLQQMRQDDASSYRLQTGGSAGARVLALVQAGQALSRSSEPQPVELGARPLAFSSSGRPLTIAFTLLDESIGHINPVRIAGMGFRDTVNAPAGDLGGISGLLGAEVAFLDVPEKAVAVRPGAELLLRGVRGTLHALSLETAGIAANFAGTLDGATLTVGDKHRELRPTYFEYLLHSQTARFFVGLLALLGSLEQLWELLRRR